MMVGALSMWTFLAKSPLVRRIQIACIVYLWLFAIFFAWDKPVVGFAVIAVGGIALLVFLYLRRQKSKLANVGDEN